MSTEECKIHGQRARLSYTVSYKGVVVGGISDYHPEKIDITMTKTIDHIEGESEDEIQKRLDGLELIEELLCQDVEGSVMSKIKKIKRGKK